jgi:hypothetical protein
MTTDSVLQPFVTLRFTRLPCWNIRVDWTNYNESVLWKNVNLCKFNVLRLRYDPGTKTTSFVAE